MKSDMSTNLHVVNRPLNGYDSLLSILSFVQEGDGLIFIESAVYSLIRYEEQLATFILKFDNMVEMFGLMPDIQARGIENITAEWVEMIGYDGFVMLTERHGKVLTW